MSEEYSTNEQLKIPQQIQSYLDDHKEQLSSEIYKELSKLNLEQFKICSNNLYKITYLVNSLLRYNRNNFQLVSNKLENIIKIPEEVFVQLKNHIENGGQCIDCNLAFDIVKKQLHNFPISINIGGDTHCNDDDCIELAEYHREIIINQPLIVVSIEKA